MEVQGKELAQAKDGVAKASKALKDNQSLLEKERRSTKAALEEKVSGMVE